MFQMKPFQFDTFIPKRNTRFFGTFLNCVINLILQEEAPVKKRDDASNVLNKGDKKH